MEEKTIQRIEKEGYAITKSKNTKLKQNETTTEENKNNKKKRKKNKK